MFTTVLVAVKLPVPVEDFEAFATETNERIAITMTAIFNNLIFLFHLLHVGYSCHGAPPRRSARRIVSGPKRRANKRVNWRSHRRSRSEFNTAGISGKKWKDTGRSRLYVLLLQIANQTFPPHIPARCAEVASSSRGQIMQKSLNAVFGDRSRQRGRNRFRLFTYSVLGFGESSSPA